MSEKQFPFTFPERMKEKVEKVAKERNCSVAQVIRDAIQEYLERNLIYE